MVRARRLSAKPSSVTTIGAQDLPQANAFVVEPQRQRRIIVSLRSTTELREHRRRKGDLTETARVQLKPTTAQRYLHVLVEHVEPLLGKPSEPLTVRQGLDMRSEQRGAQCKSPLTLSHTQTGEVSSWPHQHGSGPSPPHGRGENPPARTVRETPTSQGAGGAIVESCV